VRRKFNSLSDFIIDDLPKKKIHLEKEIFDLGSDTEESEKVVSVLKNGGRPKGAKNKNKAPENQISKSNSNVSGKLYF